MYSPESFLRTLFIVSSQVLWSEWMTDMRLLWVITRLWMAKMALVSALIHATYVSKGGLDEEVEGFCRMLCVI